MQPADSEHSRHLRREEHLKRPSSDLNCNPLNHLCNGNLVNSCFGAFLKHCDDQGVLSYTLAKEAMKEVFSDAHQVDLDRIFESIERENLDGKERITFQRFLVIASSIVVFSDLKGSNLDHATPEKIHEVLTSKNLKAKRSEVSNLLQFKESLNAEDFYEIYRRNPIPHSYYFLRSWYYHDRRNTTFKSIHDEEKEKRNAPLSPLNDFIAGTFAGIMITLSGHPFDTIKVRMQTSNAFSSAFHCASDTLKKEGIFGLYRGMLSPLITVPLINAVVFGAFGQCKAWFQTDELSLSHIGIAGSFAGLVNCFVATPVELVKTKLQVQYSNKRNKARFRGPIDCMKRIYLKRGAKGLFSGFSATVYRDVPGYGVTFYLYEYLKETLTPYNYTTMDLSAPTLMISGGIAGIAGWGISYPMDFVKSHLQAQGGVVPLYRKHPLLLDGGFFDCLDKQTRKHGVTHLWRGFGSCALRAFIANAVGFLSYEIAKDALIN